MNASDLKPAVPVGALPGKVVRVLYAVAEQFTHDRPGVVLGPDDLVIAFGLAAYDVCDEGAASLAVEARETAPVVDVAGMTRGEYALWLRRMIAGDAFKATVGQEYEWGPADNEPVIPPEPERKPVRPGLPAQREPLDGIR